MGFFDNFRGLGNLPPIAQSGNIGGNPNHVGIWGGSPVVGPPAAAPPKPHMARGGKLGVMRPLKMHEPKHIYHEHGLFHTDGPGRTDNLHVKVKNNAYVVPADVVGALGENNTLAGAKMLDSLTGVSGNKTPGNPAMKEPGHFSSGGTVKTIPIIVAGGEYLCSPESIEKIGRDSLEKLGKKTSGADHSIREGHKVMDAFVKYIREKNIKKLKTLPGPKK